MVPDCKFADYAVVRPQCKDIVYDLLAGPVLFITLVYSFLFILFILAQTISHAIGWT